MEIKRVSERYRERERNRSEKIGNAKLMPLVRILLIPLIKIVQIHATTV